MIEMLQDQSKARHFTSGEPFCTREWGVESKIPTEHRFDTMIINHPYMTPQSNPLRKRSLSQTDSQTQGPPLKVSLTSRPSEKRTKVATAASPQYFGLSIPLKKASWWKTGGEIPRSMAAESTLPPLAPSTAALKVQRTAFIGSDSQCNGANTLLKQQQINNKNAAVATKRLPTSSPTDVVSFVRHATVAGRHERMQLLQAPLNKLDLVSALKPRSPSYGNATISPILNLLQQSSPHRGTTMVHQQEQQQHTRLQTIDDDGSHDEHSSSGDSGGLNFRAYQAENWTEKFEELIEFRRQYGHCLVPNAFTKNAALAQWVKRQRYQYKLKLENKRSTMSDERVHALDEIGFIWDSHRVVWDERLQELLVYKQMAGHCNVPSRYNANRQLAIWVKRQRRQYKFYTEGKPSSMTDERINRLAAIGFEWDLRKRTDDEA